MKAKRNKQAVEEIGGDRQAMSPIIALILYSDSELLVRLQAIGMNFPQLEVTVFDEELGRDVLTPSILKDYKNIKVDRSKLIDRLESDLLGWQDLMSAGDAALALHRQMKSIVEDCAKILYQRLIDGRLVASGFRVSERRRFDIPREKWSNKRFQLDFCVAAAGVKPRHEYLHIEIRDMGFPERGRKSKTGPKTDVVVAAALAMRRHGLNPEDYSSQRKLCDAIHPLILKADGSEYSLDTLATNYEKIINKYNKLNK